MELPAAADLVRVWELGRDRPDWLRALLLLAPAFPHRSFDQLAQMTVGQRNIALFRLRERLFGPDLTAVVQCPRCGEASEFTARVDELCPHGLAMDAPAPQFSVEIGGERVWCRCPTSLDLASLGEAAGGADMSAALIDRCLNREPSLGPALPPQLIAQISDAACEHDPQLTLSLNIACAGCGHDWISPFDCAAFVWTELGGACRRVLDDVHVLANAYGWGEGEILAMSAVRRSFYLERAAP